MHPSRRLHVALGVAYWRISRVQIPGEEPSSATFSPVELHPFAVRCEFRYVEDDDGERRFWLVGSPALVEPPGAQEPVEITSTHLRTLEEHRRRYRAIAACLVDVDFRGAAQAREAMIEASRNRRKGEPLTDLYLLDLGAEFSARIDEYGDRLVDDLALSRGVGRPEMWRQLKKSAAAGFIPGGYPPAGGGSSGQSPAASSRISSSVKRSSHQARSAGVTRGSRVERQSPQRGARPSSR